MDHIHYTAAPPDTRTLQNQPTSTADSPTDEVMADTDEPPDEKQLAAIKLEPNSPEFKKISCTMSRKQSLLTQTFHSSESESVHDEDIFSNSTRAHSTASTWSRGSIASTSASDDHASDTRAGSPIAPLSPITAQIPTFNQHPFNGPSSLLKPHEPIDPLRKPDTKPNPPAMTTSADAVEAFMKRKRCITFMCGKKEDAKKEEPAEKEPIKEEIKQAEPVKRPSMLKFACPMRPTEATTKPHIRLSSPPPPRRIALSPRVHTRSHRGSDSTVRNDSPKSVRKMSSVHARRLSLGSDVGKSEATRFHEFATSGDEDEDWTHEQTCHRNRLTVEDTLRLENGLRKLGKEAEDEAMEEEMDDMEQDVDEEGEDEDEDDDEDDNDSVGMAESTYYVSDEGFASDDEQGFAGSDDESDAGSDYQFWVPGATSSGEHLEHIRPPRSRRSNSDSSLESFSSTRVFPSRTPNVKRKKTHAMEIRPRTPDLPDSTDFVCGTLDEDRPLEQAYISCVEQRRAAKHRPIPQDIDPTFPASDPEMDEEDEDTDENIAHHDDSDHHMFIHGNPDMHMDIDERQPRGIIPQKRSPPHSPKRMRSPPPNKRVVHRSPPPRRLFGGHSPKRMRSPQPARHLRSPPPTRRTSFAIGHHPELAATPIGLAARPHGDFRETNSVPRNGPFRIQRPPMHEESDNGDDQDATPTDAVFTRGAIDIVKGLEKKRQRRREKLMEKHCRQRGKGKDKQRHQHFVLPGKGAERMREMGMELAALRGKKNMGFAGMGEGQHILSY